MTSNGYVRSLAARRAMLVLLAAAAALGCSLPEAVAARHGAPCTRTALTAGLHRGANTRPSGYVSGSSPGGPRAFGCVGIYAWAGVVVNGNGETAVFRASHGRWATMDKVPVCDHTLKVPRVIYHWACEVS